MQKRDGAVSQVVTGAGDILDEIAAVLLKRGCIMQAKPEGFVLARVLEPGKAEAIAIINQISADGIEYRPCGKEMRIKFQ